MPPRIVVVGSSNTDLVVRAPALPGPGETVLGSSFLVTPGGKGANQAVAAARLGARVTLVVRLGADDFGDRALAALGREGIDTRFVARDAEAASGVALIVVSESGENAIAVAPGANMRLTAADVDRAAPAIREADMLLLQLETPLPTVRHAATLAMKAGVPVILNPAPAAPLAGELLSRVSVLTPNELEAAALTGASAYGVDAARQAAQRLHASGVANVVITLGREGALMEGEAGSGHVPGCTVTAVDTTAAGDAFNGALAVALAEGASLEHAVRFANRAAALSITRPGAQPSLPTREAVESFAAAR
ncbi:MAG: ribokinase [Gemmatimonadota bacterium]